MPPVCTGEHRPKGSRGERYRHRIHHPGWDRHRPGWVWGTPAGGWVFRHGPEAVAGDRFRLGSVLDEGVLLLGRKTWELFSRIWPGRDDPFSARMNAVPKLVATRTLTGTSAWVNSQAVDGDIIDAVKRQRRDVVIMGS